LWFNDQIIIFLQSKAQRNAALPGQSAPQSLASIEVGKSADIEKSKVFDNSFIDGKSLKDVSESHNHNSMETTAVSFNITITPTLPVAMDTVACTCVNPTVHNSLSIEGNRL
jgi:hypothetical protein